MKSTVDPLRMGSMIADILFNSFGATLFFTMGSEQILYAMVAFGLDYSTPLAVSVLGSTVGHVFHYMLGRYFALLREKQAAIFPDATYRQLAHYARRYGTWMLLFFGFPLYALFPILAGFFRSPLWLSFTLIVCAQLAERLYAIRHILEVMAR